MRYVGTLPKDVAASEEEVGAGYVALSSAASLRRDGQGEDRSWMDGETNGRLGCALPIKVLLAKVAELFHGFCPPQGSFRAISRDVLG